MVGIWRGLLAYAVVLVVLQITVYYFARRRGDDANYPSTDVEETSARRPRSHRSEPVNEEAPGSQPIDERPRSSESFDGEPPVPDSADESSAIPASMGEDAAVPDPTRKERSTETAADARFCPHCGAANERDVAFRFCWYCAGKLDG